MRTLILAVLFTVPLWSEDSLLLILHKAASSLGFYTPSGKLLTAVPVGAHPHEMTMSLDGRYVYTTDNGTMRIEEAGTGGNTVSIVDIAARRKIGEISLGKYHRPHGIDIDRRNGQLAVSTELPDALLIVDPARRVVVKAYETRGKTSHMVKFGPGYARAFVNNSTSNDVSAIALADGSVTRIPAGARPEGSVLSKDGAELYVCDREGAKITVINTLKPAAAGEIKTGNGPVRIGITPDGRLLVYSLMHDQSVQWADPRTRKVLGQVKLNGRPVSLAVSRDGRRAFASAEDQDTVYVVSLAARKIVETIHTPKGSGPDAIMEIAAK